MASFKEAFAAARKAQGAGGEFTWKGKPYSTNIVGETGKKKKPSFSVDMAEKAIDNASGIQTPDASTPRPQKRPTEIAKGIDVSDGGIKVSKLPKDEKGGSGAAGAAGAAAAIGAGAAILASGLRNGAGGAGRASAKLLPAQSTVLRLPAPPKALPAPDARRAEDKDSKNKTVKNARRTEDKKARRTISPKNASPVSQNSRRSGRVGGPMMGDDPMYNAIQGGGFGALEDLGREGLINMKKGGVVKMKKGGTLTTSEGLKGLALRVGNQKANESLKQRSSYNDKGASGRDFAAKQDNARMESLTATHNRSKDMVKRYGTDAPKARGFMAYEGQSGTTKKQSGGVVKKMSIPGTVSSGSGNPNKALSMRGESKYQGDLTRRSGGGVVKKAGGGSMRGAGAAVRGKGFSGCY
jgi:hypothetical protein